MASRLTVIFYIILCLEAGIVLTVVPWVQPFGMGDWGDNYFLLYASQKIGYGLQQAVSSGWVRGAVTGLGLLNLAMAFWEIAHFKETVRRLQGSVSGEPATLSGADRAGNELAPPAPTHTTSDVSQPAQADYLPDHARRDDTRDHHGE
jgi:hypothetical protein